MIALDNQGVLSLKRTRGEDPLTIFAPKSTNNTQKQQAQRKKMVKCIVAIPRFLKAWSASHTFFYSKTNKTPSSFLFHVLCYGSFLFISLSLALHLTPLSMLSSPSLYTFLYLKNGFSHNLLNLLYYFQTLSIASLFLFSIFSIFLSSLWTLSLSSL